MDGATIVQLIGSLGFPIIACLGMGWYVKNLTDKHSKQIDDLTVRHNEEMTKVTEALNNNTLALQRLCDKLGE